MTSTKHRRGRHGLRIWGWARHATCAFLILAFVASAAFGSASYIWCIPMAKAMSSCCCPGDWGGHQDHADESDARDSVVSAPCCVTRHVDSLVAASPIVRAEMTHHPALSWVTLPWASAWMLQVPTSLDLLTAHPALAGPPPPKIPKYMRVRRLLL